MTDTNVVPMTQQSQQPTSPQMPQQPQTDAERIDAIKLFLFQGSLKHYQEFSSGVQRLPCDSNLKRIILEKLDDAWLWVKEAFQVLQIELPKPPQVVPSKSAQKRKKAQKSKKR